MNIQKTSQSSPLVSVVIPTFNREHFLSRAINSVLNQIYENFELLIVDDASTDGTQALLTSLTDPRIILLHTSQLDKIDLPDESPGWMPGDHSNMNNLSPLGVSCARNLGIQYAKGEYIAFLDSDDEWSPQKLEIQVSHLKDSSMYWVHCNEFWIKNQIRIPQLQKHKKAGGDQFERALEICCIGASCVLIHRSILSEVGGFKPKLKVCEDYDLWLRILAKYPIAFVEEELVTKYAGHDGQLSFQNKAIDEYRVLALKELVENVELTPTQRSSAKDHLIKKSKILEKGFRKYLNNEKADYYQSLQISFSGE